MSTKPKMAKLKQKDLPSFRESLLKKQRGKCTLCGYPLKSEDANLDHDHISGRCRASVHRECNILLGKIENYIKRYGKVFRTDKNRLKGFLKNTFGYMEKDYKDMPYHPKHKLPRDKKLAALKRRLKNAKRESTKQRLRCEIKNLR